MSHDINHQTLVDLALGHLDPQRREDVELCIRSDQALRAEYAEVTHHLRRWDALDTAPEPPPLARVLAALEREDHVHRAAPLRLRPLPVVAAAVFLLLVVGAALLVTDRGPGASPTIGQAGAGLRVRGRFAAGDDGGVLRAGDVVDATSPAELRLGSRVRVVLDADTTLAVTAGDAVELERGRAFFEVEKGAFRVTTRHGDVRVLGTAFQVAVDEDGVQVGVETGRVEFGDEVVEAGEWWPRASQHDALARWFREPRLRLVVPDDVSVGGTLSLELVFSNETWLPVELEGELSAPTSVWVRVVGPDGTVQPLPVDVPQDLVEPGGVLRIPPRRERRMTAVIAPRLGQPGTYRCQAMYRPWLFSDVVLFEVSE